MAIKLIARPTSAKRRQELVRVEVKEALDKLGETSIEELNKQIANWDEKPEFKSVVSVGERVWKFFIKVNRQTKIGKIFTWVDQGTGERGNIPKSPYEILPRKAKALKFIAPLPPKSMPYPTVAGFPKIGQPKEITTQAVIHPGIYPRNFTTVVKNFLRGRHAGSFRNTIEAAVKRAYRKIEKNEAQA